MRYANLLKGFMPDSLCSPVLVPQMVGGPSPLGLLTENVSVRHCDAVVASAPAAVTPVGSPFRRAATVVVEVDGPVIWKVWKSSRSCGGKRRSAPSHK